MSILYTFLASASDAINTGAAAACGSSCNTTGLGTVFHNLANTLTFVVGSVSVIMIIIGGLRYVISQGDSKAAAEGKQTILYAVIGVVVSIVAYAIVSFVSTSVSK